MADVFKDGLLHGQHALITGGGSGIGLGVARHLARDGAAAQRRRHVLNLRHLLADGLGVGAFAGPFKVHAPARTVGVAGDQVMLELIRPDCTVLVLRLNQVAVLWLWM